MMNTNVLLKKSQCGFILISVMAITQVFLEILMTARPIGFSFPRALFSAGFLTLQRLFMVPVHFRNFLFGLLGRWR